jgi:hypothetical protein
VQSVAWESEEGVAIFWVVVESVPGKTKSVILNHD